MGQEVVRKSLVKCMRSLMRRRAFTSITIEDICDLAGISRRSFYRYYKDKYELLSDIYENYYFSRLEKHPEWTVWDCHEEICQQIYDDADFFRHAALVKGQNGFWECCKKVLLPLTMKDLENFNMSKESRAYMKTFFEFDTDVLFTIMEEWLNSSPMEDPVTFSRNVRRAFEEHARFQTWMTSKT